jgi:flagellar biosynthetic protein FliR
MTSAITLWLLVMGRVGGMLAVMPVFSTMGIPRWVVPLLALATSGLVAMSQPVPASEPELLELAFALGGELLLGSVMGLGVAATFAAMALGAEVMSMQMGLSFATLLDPLTHSHEGALGSFASWLAALVFVTLGLHARCIEIVARSFAAVPPGSAYVSARHAWLLAEQTGEAISLGVQLAGPILAMVWLVHLFVALLSKLAPKMHAFFSVGTTTTGFVGLGMLGVALPWLLAVHGAAMVQATERLAHGSWGP